MKVDNFPRTGIVIYLLFQTSNLFRFFYPDRPGGSLPWIRLPTSCQGGFKRLAMNSKKKNLNGLYAKLRSLDIDTNLQNLSGLLGA